MEVKEFLDTRKFPGEILFAKLWGSRSHDCAKETSDWDFSGVYVVPTKQVLGMYGFKDTEDNPEGSKPDFSFHEVGKFCTLLIKGNPGILEMLWTDRMCIDTPEWLELKKERRRFLSKLAAQSYLSYAGGQLRKHEKGSYLHTSGGDQSEKWNYHILRLLGDAQRILEGDEPVVWKEGVEKDSLMRVRRQEIGNEEVIKLARKKLDKLDEMFKISKLPEQGDKEFLNEWLLKVRSQN